MMVCGCSVCAYNLGNVVDVHVATLFNGVLVARGLSGLQWLVGEGGGLQDEGCLRRRGLEEEKKTMVTMRTLKNTS